MECVRAEGVCSACRSGLAWCMRRWKLLASALPDSDSGLSSWLCLLLPMSRAHADNKLRNNHKLIHEYFTHFLAHDQIVAHFPEVTEDSIIRLGKDHVIYSGYYTFELTKDGVTKAAKAK